MAKQKSLSSNALPADTVTLSREAQLRAFFEAEVNRESFLYNLQEGVDKMYWSLHTERAFKVFMLGVAFADQEKSHG